MAGDKPRTAAGAVLAVVAAGLGLASSFGLSITPQEHDAILTFCAAVAVVAPLVGALFDHSSTQVAAREQAAVTIAQGQSPAARAGSQIQARIDELTRQKEALQK